MSSILHETRVLGEPRNGYVVILRDVEREHVGLRTVAQTAADSRNAAPQADLPVDRFSSFVPSRGRRRLRARSTQLISGAGG